MERTIRRTVSILLLPVMLLGLIPLPSAASAVTMPYRLFTTEALSGEALVSLPKRELLATRAHQFHGLLLMAGALLVQAGMTGVGMVLGLQQNIDWPACAASENPDLKMYWLLYAPESELQQRFSHYPNPEIHIRLIRQVRKASGGKFFKTIRELRVHAQMNHWSQDRSWSIIARELKIINRPQPDVRDRKTKGKRTAKTVKPDVGVVPPLQKTPLPSFVPHRRKTRQTPDKVGIRSEEADVLLRSSKAYLLELITEATRYGIEMKDILCSVVAVAAPNINTSVLNQFLHKGALNVQLAEFFSSLYSVFDGIPSEQMAILMAFRMNRGPLSSVADRLIPPAVIKEFIDVHDRTQRTLPKLILHLRNSPLRKGFFYSDKVPLDSGWDSQTESVKAGYVFQRVNYVRDEHRSISEMTPTTIIRIGDHIRMHSMTAPPVNHTPPAITRSKRSA